MGLPRARHHEALVEAPLMTVRGTDVLVDGRVVASTEPIVASAKMQRLDGELAALKALREAFKARQPGEAFPGVLLLELDASTKGAVVMSLFQTATFAGFPNVSFVVEPAEAPGQRARLPVDAWIPGPPGEPFDSEPRLLVEASTPTPSLQGWLTGAELDASPGGDGALADRVAEAWKTRGRHKAPDDPRIDQAIVEVGGDSVLADVIAALDAIRAVEREQTVGGVRSTIPAFNVTLRLKGFRDVQPGPAAPPPARGASVGTISVRGRLPPEVIVRILRASLPAYAACRKTDETRTLPLRFAIAASGSVSTAEVVGTTRDDTLATCVVGVTKRLSFPEPEGGPVQVDAPMRVMP